MSKKTNSFWNAPVGSWERFKNCVNKFKWKYWEEWARRICASIWRQKYWNEAFQKMAIKARKRKSK